MDELNISEELPKIRKHLNALAVFASLTFGILVAHVLIIPFVNKEKDNAT